MRRVGVALLLAISVVLAGAIVAAPGMASATARHKAAGHSKPATPRTDGSIPAPQSIVRLVTHVPVATLNAVGAGDVVTGGVALRVLKLHSHLGSNGKPELLSMNLAWCPHCAAENYSLAVALSRFGTLSNLRVINTGTHYCKLSHAPCLLKPFPCYPFTKGISFFGTSFDSKYLSFVDVAIQDVKGHNLQRVSRRERHALGGWDRHGETPAVDIGGAYGLLGSGVDPGTISGKSWSETARSLANPHSPIAQRVDGLANLLTAAICVSTKGRPANVCKQPGVGAAGDAHLH